jgi:hypothetical protein
MMIRENRWLTEAEAILAAPERPGQLQRALVLAVMACAEELSCIELQLQELRAVFVEAQPI